MSNRVLTSGDVCEVAGCPINTLDSWTARGLLGLDKATRSGRGNHRSYTPIAALAVAAGVRWQKAGADPERVASVIQFIARQPKEHLEASFVEGKTFPVPAVMLQGFELNGTGGMFIVPEREGGAARLFEELDLARCWEEVLAKIAKLPPQRKRGRKAGVKVKRTK